ncbi:MAG: HD domain-containing protein [Selenomonadaceae bacterium]|nr:HD domain-containing protein [Selenomonadaceae bacterium]MBQ6131033.1 HD domain-containing protein [Selenomonadaceae bacterium]MBQ7493786.1 HD domain-containing protein [Selenomonadaceae bacterium]
MLKSYDVTELRAGMTVGRAVKDLDGKILIKAGAKLTSELLDGLRGKNIFSVYIDVTPEDYKPTEASQEHLLDLDYIRCYRKCFTLTQNLYYGFANTGKLDKNQLVELIRAENISELCDDGAKAVTQIHNMKRDGDYIIHHALNVGILAGIMAHWLDYRATQVGELVIAGLLSEIGKMKISKGILNKTEKLDADELAEVRKHVVFGYALLTESPLRSLKNVLLGVLHHHERCDGSGYPSKLKGDKISDFGKIIAILDIYDAMATNRSYAKRNSPFDIIKVLYGDALGGKLDTRFVITFTKKLLQAINGSWVGLSDGQRGKIVYLDDSRVTALPIVQTTKGEFVDLNRRSDIKVDALLTAQEAT